MDTKGEYYIPKIEELTQGVKYEYLSTRKGEKTHGYIILGEEPVWNYQEEDEWVEKEVWYDREPLHMTVENDMGGTSSWQEIDMYDLQPARDFTKQGHSNYQEVPFG